MSAASVPTVLHYLGDDQEREDLVSVLRTLAAEGKFACVLGVATGSAAQQSAVLPPIAFPALPAGEQGLKTLWRARRVADQAERWLASWPDRVFHAHSHGGLAAALWLQRRGQRRVVASVHEYGRSRWFYRWAARQLGERLFWLTPAMKRHYGREVPGDSWAQCLPAGVPLAPAARPAIGEQRILRVGGIGPFVSRRCWHLVLDAMAAMPVVQRWKVRFDHVGEATRTEKSKRYAHALRTQTGALSLGNLVNWRGAEISPARLLQEIDVLVMPSMREGLSVPMLEALAAGVPVLAANSGGARDVIVSAKNGWLFRSGDPHDLARALIMLVETDALRTVQSVPDRSWRFAAANAAEKWAQVYARVLAVK